MSCRAWPRLSRLSPRLHAAQGYSRQRVNASPQRHSGRPAEFQPVGPPGRHRSGPRLLPAHQSARATFAPRALPQGIVWGLQRAALSACVRGVLGKVWCGGVREALGLDEPCCSRQVVAWQRRGAVQLSRQSVLAGASKVGGRRMCARRQGSAGQQKAAGLKCRRGRRGSQRATEKGRTPRTGAGRPGGRPASGRAAARRGRPWRAARRARPRA
jgi:hypothetical protein